MPIQLFRPSVDGPEGSRSTRATAVDPAYAALPALRALRDSLISAARFQAACRQAARTKSLPPLFFFDPRRQAELVAARPTGAPEPFVAEVAARLPLEAVAWDGLDEQAARVWPSLTADVEVRHAARAVAGLRESAVALAPHHPAARDLADLLAGLDDEVLLVLAPAHRAGYRLTMTGVVELQQLHVLLADLLSGQESGGFLYGLPPSAAVVAAYRESDASCEELLARAAFQMFAPSALRPDGTLPAGLAGSAHWIWPHRPASTLPLLDGERVILVGEAAFESAWPVERRFPEMTAEMRIVKALSPAEVEECLSKWLGRALPKRAAAPAAARAA